MASTKSSWSHLGIQIPVNFQEICKANFNKIVNESKLLFDKWHKMNMSWNGRMELVKVFIFPIFLYLFRSIPLILSNQDLKKWQNLFNNFIWAKNLHRISFNTLRKKSRKGGIPDLYLYYVATNLSSIVQLLTTNDMAPWMGIEWSEKLLYLIKTYLQQAKTDITQIIRDNPFLMTSLNIWDS